MTKIAAGGLAVVFPAVGVPAVAGLAIANKTLDEVDPAKHAATAKLAVTHATAAKVAVARARQAKGAAKAALIAKAKEHQASAKALARKGKRMERARANLAKKLANAQQLASAGDVSAQRALATFQLVQRAKAGDAEALAAAKTIRERHDIGQAVRQHFTMHPNGRVVFTGRAGARVGVDDPQIFGVNETVGADWNATVNIGSHSFHGHGSVAGDPPPWVADRKLWARAERIVAPHANRYSDPYAVVTTVYKRMGGRVA
ncbi:MAG TPA: hypothetical protein VF420_13400 [Casimicrobiaceae bacterium]